MQTSKWLMAISTVRGLPTPFDFADVCQAARLFDIPQRRKWIASVGRTRGEVLAISYNRAQT